MVPTPTENRIREIETQVKKMAKGIEGLEKYFKQMINYQAATAQLIKHQINQNTATNKLLQEVLNGDDRRELTGKGPKRITNKR